MRSSRPGSDSLPCPGHAVWPAPGRAFSVLWLGAFVLLAPAAGAASITIDDFESGDFSLSAVNDTGDAEIVAAATAIGGERYVTLRGLGAAASTMSLSTTGGDDAVVFEVGDTGGSVGFQYGWAYPGGPRDPSWDLSAAEAFRITFDAAPASGGTVIMVIDTEMDNNWTEGLTRAKPISGAGSVLVPFSSFESIDRLDFSDVDGITVIAYSNSTPHVTYRIASIEAVPEPAAVLLLGVGLAAVGLVRRGFRSRP